MVGILKGDETPSTPKRRLQKNNQQQRGRGVGAGSGVMGRAQAGRSKGKSAAGTGFVSEEEDYAHSFQYGANQEEDMLEPIRLPDVKYLQRYV